MVMRGVVFRVWSLCCVVVYCWLLFDDGVAEAEGLGSDFEGDLRTRVYL